MLKQYVERRKQLFFAALPTAFKKAQDYFDIQDHPSPEISFMRIKRANLKSVARYCRNTKKIELFPVALYLAPRALIVPLLTHECVHYLHYTTTNFHATSRLSRCLSEGLTSQLYSRRNIYDRIENRFDVLKVRFFMLVQSMIIASTHPKQVLLDVSRFIVRPFLSKEKLAVWAQKHEFLLDPYGDGAEFVRRMESLGVARRNLLNLNPPANTFELFGLAKQ